MSAKKELKKERRGKSVLLCCCVVVLLCCCVVVFIFVSYNDVVIHIIRFCKGCKECGNFDEENREGIYSLMCISIVFL